MVEHSTADREVPGSNPGVPFFVIIVHIILFFSFNIEKLLKSKLNDESSDNEQNAINEEHNLDPTINGKTVAVEVNKQSSKTSGYSHDQKYNAIFLLCVIPLVFYQVP